MTINLTTMVKNATAFLTVFLLLIFNLPTAEGQTPQVWTYDFGDGTGTHTSDASTTFLPFLQTGGGSDVRVRVGSSGGEIHLESSNIGTFSQLRLTAAETTSDILFQIGEFDGSSTFYTKFTMRFSGGNSGIIGFLFGNGSNFLGNSGYVGSSFSGFRSTFSGDGTLLTERRTGSGWSDAFSIDTILEKDVTYTIEIYANNSSNSTTYHRDGVENTLPSRNWSLWIDGTEFNSFGSVGLSVDEIIDGFMFYGQNSTDNVAEIEIDDIFYSNNLPDIRTIDGDAGWRMLAAPHDGFNIDQLARQNMVQGVTDGDFPSAAPNVYVGYDGSTFLEAASTSTTLNRGEGFIWYLYDNANVPVSKPLPLDLTAAKNQPTGDVTVTLHDNADGFNLAGNPFSEGLNVSGIGGWATGGSLASTVVQIWDPSAGVSGSYTNPTSDVVSSFQGFFIENDNAAQLVIPESAITTEQEFFKDNLDRRIIAFELNNEDQGYVDKSIRLVFDEAAVHDWDVNDGSKLYPLTSSFIGMGFKGYRNGESVLKAQDSRPYNLDEAVAIPMEFFSSNVGGDMTLSISAMDNIPDGWTIEMEDRELGERQIIDSNNSITFYVENSDSPSKIQQKENSLSAPKVAAASEETQSRFVLHITPSDSELGGNQLPETVTLKQNYPNPFNPATTISYEVPETSNVLLEVYDMLGRQVATLVNEQVSAGEYEVDFNAANLSSGVYIYRLTTANTVINRKLTVLK